MTCEEVLKDDGTLLLEQQRKIFQELYEQFKNKGKSELVKGFCVTRHMIVEASGRR